VSVGRQPVEMFLSSRTVPGTEELHWCKDFVEAGCLVSIAVMVGDGEGGDQAGQHQLLDQMW